MALYYDTGSSPNGTTNAGGSSMNPSVLLALVAMMRDDKRDFRHDRFRTFEEIKLIFPSLTPAQIWSLIDIVEGREERRETMMPLVVAMMASQSQASSSTTTTPATTTTTTSIDPTALLAMALLSQQW
jgi:hypothetical protein